MTNEALRCINDVLNDLIPYEFMQWTDPVVYPYWIGEYTEVTPMSEDGEEESTFILTGTAHVTWLELEEQKEIIRTAFPAVSGKFFVLESGHTIGIWYDTASHIPTDNNNIKRLQVDLQVKEWKVNE